MTHAVDPHWIETLHATIRSYRRMIDGTLIQLTDRELFERPAPCVNSVAVILRHLGGNLKSRWTDYRTTDGEKPSRDRDAEFRDWESDRAALMLHFEEGWNCLEAAFQSIDDNIVMDTIYIRGEAHTIAEALVRSVTHVTYHVGQIAMTARLVHDGEWNWLTVAPENSKEHNRNTWGTSASRSVFADDEDETS